jgi:epoxyqueuosine reductase
VIPDSVRNETGGWVFGCDVCQTVCPWNDRFALPSTDPSFQTRPFLKQATLDTLLTLDRQRYVEGLRRSPLKRAKLRGLKRNACLAAANLGSTEHVPALAAALSDPEPQVRLHAAWALGQIGGDRAQTCLIGHSEDEDNPEVQRTIAQALAQISDG